MLTSLPPGPTPSKFLAWLLFTPLLPIICPASVG
jgi:hypothetical protein